MHALTPPDLPPRAPTRHPRSSSQTRDRLARAALDLFTTRGYHETTTPLIAARAGVAEGTIYRHFPSKEDLLNEVFRAGVRAFLEPVKASDPIQPCRERLDGIATRWTAIAAANPALVRLVFDQTLTRLLDERSRAALRDLRGQIEQAMAGGKAAGHVRRGGADLWTEVWLRLILLTLERVAGGQWQPGDAATTQVRRAAWDAIRVEVQTDTDGATIHDPASGELP
ncbi:MAG: TetR/AcrR family transcriptional regulator [Gemmatimonadota bacterium]|nr:TetR/AcrR family transcriptional regulator [Gemmatimonadota bacterium]